MNILIWSTQRLWLRSFSRMGTVTETALRSHRGCLARKMLAWTTPRIVFEAQIPMLRMVIIIGPRVTRRFPARQQPGLLRELSERRLPHIRRAM